MPRHARFRLDGYPFHIVHRGNNRGACFVDEFDRRFYLELLEQFTVEDRCDLHAFVLMTNHVHLLVTPEQATSVSQFMKNVAQRYTQRFNKKHKRTGSLWEGRFHSSIVDTGYLLYCQRYIDLNPVRAGMVRHPAFYRWSSYHAYADGVASTLVKPHRHFMTLGSDEQSRRAAYLTFLNEAVSPVELERIRSAGRGGFALGGSEFEARIASLRGKSAVRASQQR
jgi:putative transposase